MPATATKPAKKPVAKKRFAQVPRYALELAIGVDTSYNNDAAGRVDKEQGIIYGVKLVGVQSNNKARTIGLSYGQVGEAANHPYRYSMAGLKVAIPLYEGASVYSNHVPFEHDPKTGHRQMLAVERDNDDLLGWVKDVRAVEIGNPDIDGLYGDFHYLKKHRLAETLVEVAERNPMKLALSHEAYFEDPVVESGRVVLSKVIKVDGLALVNQKPGTTRGLFETLAEDNFMPRTIRQVIESATGDDVAKRRCGALLELMGGPPFDTSTANAPAPDAMQPGMGAEQPPAVDADAAIKAAFRVAVMAAFDDPTLDTSATLDKIDDILNAMEQVLGTGKAEVSANPAENGEGDGEGDGSGEGDGEGSGEGDGGGEGDGKKKNPFAKESTEMDRGPLIIECSGLLTGAGIMPTANVLESMAALPTPEKRAAYVQELAALKTPATPGKAPVVPVPRSTVPSPAVNPAGAPVQEKAVPEYKAGELARGFFTRGIG